MKKYLFLLLIVPILLFSSCSADKESDTLDIALSQEPPVFDVHVNSSQSARIIMAGNVFERLVTLDGRGEAVCELADSFYSLDDNRSWVFVLRKGVLFHNGEEMTSLDAVLSLNRWLDYNVSASSMLSGARFYAVDDYTVRIDSPSPALFLPQLMAASPQSAVIYSHRMFDTLDDDGLITEYIGTGPYRFVQWKKGESLSLTRFEDYCPYGGEMDGLAGYKHAYIRNLVYWFIPDSFARTAGCETGRYLFINEVMNDDIPRLEKNSSLVVSRKEEAGSLVLLLNKREGLCTQQYIRTAVNLALDLDTVMAACYGSGGYVMHPDYMESQQKLWAVTDDEPRYDAGDKEGAGRILEENGYDGSVVRILTSNLSNMDKSALAVKSELEKAGFACEVIVVDWATMMEYRSDSSRWDICVTAMTQVPVPSLKLFLSPDYAGWSDDSRLAEMMGKLNESRTLDEASMLWKEIQSYCYDYLPAIVCGHYQSGNLYRKELSGVIEYYGFYFYNATVRS